MSMDITVGMISKTKSFEQLEEILNKIEKVADEVADYNRDCRDIYIEDCVPSDMIPYPQLYGDFSRREFEVGGYHVLKFVLRNTFISDIIELIYNPRFSYDLAIFEDVYFIEWNDCGDGSIDGYLVYTIPNKNNEIFKRDTIYTELNGGSRIYPAFLNYSYETSIPEDTLQELVVKTIDIFD